MWHYEIVTHTYYCLTQRSCQVVLPDTNKSTSGQCCDILMSQYMYWNIHLVKHRMPLILLDMKWYIYFDPFLSECVEHSQSTASGLCELSICMPPVRQRYSVRACVCVYVCARTCTVRYFPGCVSHVLFCCSRQMTFVLRRWGQIWLSHSLSLSPSLSVSLSSPPPLSVCLSAREASN